MSADQLVDGTDIPSNFLCPITGALMKEPFMTCDGITYEKRAIQISLGRSNNSPVTGKTLRNSKLINNNALKSMIQDFIVANAKPVPDEFRCPISLEIMEDPVIIADGVSYERREIQYWLLTHSISPVTRQELPNRTVIDNRALKSAIQRYKNLMRNKFDVLVQTLENRTVAVSVTPTTTILELKEKIQWIGGGPPDQQRLITCGKQLEDDRTISDYNLQPLVTIHVLHRLRGC